MQYVRPIILFLDEDLKKSARSLTNYFLEKNISSTAQVLMCALFYFTGLRNRTLFKHYVSRERWDDTKFKYFRNYPLKSLPVYTFYNSEESRWCRKCLDHYNYVCDYLDELLAEYEFRFGKPHKEAEMGNFLREEPMSIAVGNGIIIPTLKNKSKFRLPWKNLPPKYRKKDIILGYRKYYSSIILSPLDAFVGSKRDVPDFLQKKMEATLDGI
jgi:hypothetical protein